MLISVEGGEEEGRGYRREEWRKGGREGGREGEGEREKYMVWEMEGQQTMHMEEFHSRNLYALQPNDTHLCHFQLTLFTTA